MKNKKIDLFIKQKIQQDKKIDKDTKDVFIEFEENLKMENKNTHNVIPTIILKKIVSVTASFIILLFLGTNLYAHIVGKPNIFSSIKNLFINKENYEIVAEDIEMAAESNGIKLILKTAAMDDNILVLKYLAQGEKLKTEFYTYQDFEEELIVYAKMFCSLSGYDIGENTYNKITNEDCLHYLDGLKEKLITNGLTNDDAEKLIELGSNAYSYYMCVELGDKNKNEETSKELIEKTIAMFESKVLNTYNIMESNDKLANFNIMANSQTIEKVENGYIIYSIYNIDTLSDLANTFSLNLNISKIGTIEGTWNYLVELNKAELNAKVKIIDFNNQYVKNVFEKYYSEDDVTEKIDVKVSRLIISNFSSVLNIRTEAYLDNPYLANSNEIFNNEMFPLIYIVTDKEGNILGTCNSKLNAKETTDDLNTKRMNRIILKNVTENTEEIEIKIYTNNDNKLIGTFNVNLANAKEYSEINEIDTALEGVYTNPEFGIKLNYPKNWEVHDDGNDWGNSEGYSYRCSCMNIASPDDQDGYCANFGILTWKNTRQEFYMIPPEDSIETGNITIDGIQSTYRVKNIVNGDITTKHYEVCINKNDITYNILFSARDTLYAKYFETFEQILKSLTISNVEIEIIEMSYEQNNITKEFNEPSESNNVTEEISMDKQAKIDYYESEILKYKNYITEEEAKITKYNQELIKHKATLKEIEEHPEETEDYQLRLDAGKALINTLEAVINECELTITMHNYTIDFYEEELNALQ